MANKTTNSQQGHWLLAKMGKRVLRPGGKELTQKLIDNLHITSDDDIVEFAPGLGFTASIALTKNPKSYKGVELNEAAAASLRKTIGGVRRQIIIGNAAHSTLEKDSATKVFGEAMLTMQADHRKSAIIQEAFRILKTGGLYGIHELSLAPNDIPETVKAEIQRALATVIKVNARPLTSLEWSLLLEKEGFEVVTISTSPMHLLEPRRIIEDEGFLRALKIGFNILTHPYERSQIFSMRKIFKKYESHLSAVGIIAKKK
ncbi:class I SAM-dependent methyltransferase [Aureispira anguillae]|uniref:Class I SAM-dependent methyltransferase n=1 Tax=Aureispira anguillae TaxID=2864201 RepID=A0A916DUR5_9BACT|nr:class I SAM-dependent methyltransferase [Aureispira anguillae]BDS13596.1 class I SAM-dependent methyltransferase [Aureispira anguillae]